MNKAPNSNLRSKWQREDGVAILLALGIVTLVLVLGMGYAYTSLGAARQAALTSDVYGASMLADSAIQRAMSFVKDELSGTPAPHRFFKEGSGTWSDRFYVASISDTSTLDATETTLGDYTYIPSGVANSDSAPWTNILTQSDPAGTGTSSATTIIGRMAYAVFDHSGLFDPTIFVDSSLVDTNILSYALEDSPQVASVLANRLRTSMPPYGWASTNMIFRSAVTDSTEADSVAKFTLPYSVEGVQTKFWNDTNVDGVVDSSEIQDKLDVTGIGGTISAIDLYNKFTGGAPATPAEYSPWLRKIAALTAADTARHIAAQTAVNLFDAADGTTNPSRFYIDTSNLLQQWIAGSPPTNFQYQVLGVEKQYLFAEIAVDLEMDFNQPAGRLRATPDFTIGIYNPFWTTSPPFTGQIEVEYSITVDISTGNTTSSHTISTPVNTSSAYGSATATGQTITDPSSDGSYILRQILIKRVTLQAGGSILDVSPDIDVSGNLGVYNWAQSPAPSHPISAAGYTHFNSVRVQMHEPRVNGLHHGHAYYSTYTTVDTSLFAGGPAPVLPLQSGTGLDWDVAVGDYDVSEVRDASFTSIEQLGRVSAAWYYDSLPGSQPLGRSLQFWSRTIGDELTHDGQLIDLFYDALELDNGKINVNTAHSKVWEGLLYSAATDAALAADTIINGDTANNIYGTSDSPLTGIGDLARFPGIYDATSDSAAESEKLAFIRPLLSVRNQYFTVFAIGQSLRDLPGAPSLSGNDIVSWDTNRIARVIAEQRVTAVLYRDLFTGEVEVLRYEPIY